MVILVAAELVTVENPTKTLVATTRAAAPHFHLLVNRFIAAPSFSVDGRARSSKPGMQSRTTPASQYVIHHLLHDDVRSGDELSERFRRHLRAGSRGLPPAIPSPIPRSDRSRYTAGRARASRPPEPWPRLQTRSRRPNRSSSCRDSCRC